MIKFSDTLYYKTNYIPSSIDNYITLYMIAAGISISAPLPHQISPLALYQMPPSSSRPASPKPSRKPTPTSQLVIDPSSTGNSLVRPVIHLIGRNSAPGSRRGSGNSLYGSGSLIGNIIYQTKKLINQIYNICEGNYFKLALIIFF